MYKYGVSVLCLFFCLSTFYSLGQNSVETRFLVRYAWQEKGQFSVLELEDETARHKALGDPQITHAEPDYIFEISTVPDDPGLSQQWGLQNSHHPAFADIGAFTAWDIQTHTDGIAGIIDTGIDFGHEDLVQNIWQNLAEDADGDGQVLEYINGIWQLDPGDLDGIDADNNGYIDDLVGWDFVNDDNNPFDDNGHGTHVAGIFGAKGNNGIGISGVCWSVQLMALKAFDHRGAGSLSSIIAALKYARLMGVNLTNNSWGGIRYSRFLYEEIEAAEESGQLFVAASGNQGRHSHYLKVYPAGYDLDNIIAVGATNIEGKLAPFSNTSPKDVDLFAPGWYIYSTLPSNQYGLKTGTSMAAPFVAGAVILLQAAEPGLDISQLKARLLNTVQTLPAWYGKCISGGQMDLAAALGQTSLQQIGLYADFSAPHRSCTGASVVFLNTSSASAEPQYEWWIDDVLASTDAQLNWQFNQSGYYGVTLIANLNGEKDSVTRPIEITASAFADLGPDTTICASALLLEANDPDMTYIWKRLYCPGGGHCQTPYDFGTVDSIRFAEINGQTADLKTYYALTDHQGVIQKINSEARFLPPFAGDFAIYGIYSSLENQPSGLQSGSPISAVDLSNDICGGMTTALNVIVAEEEIVGTGLKSIVRESGTYILIARDGCGNTDSDTLHLTLEEGCVWPGDVDLDGQVSLLDFVSLGLAPEQSGPSRPNASVLWSSQTATDWSAAFDSLNQLSARVNYKHADCDGNGEIDLQQDAQIVKENLGAFHEINVSVDSIGAELKVVHSNTIFASEDTAILDLEFYLSGPNGTELEGIYGVLFQLNFSDPIVESPDFQADTGSWMYPTQSMNAFWDGSQITPGIQAFRNFRKTAGLAIVSADRLARRGGGGLGGGAVIVTIDDLSGDPSLHGFSTFSVSVDNLVVVDTAGHLQKVSLASGLNTITIEIVWPSANSFPVEWLAFEGTQQGEDALLNWTVMEDQSVGYYIVERSIDGHIFTPIALVPAHSDRQAPNKYAFLDPAIVQTGHSELYYRIKQLDYNGQFQYSDQLYLQLNKNFGLILQTYPNPFREQLRLSYQASSRLGLQTRILNSLGQEILGIPLPDAKGEIVLDSSQWPAGLYYIVLENAEQRRVVKLLKN